MPLPEPMPRKGRSHGGVRYWNWSREEKRDAIICILLVLAAILIVFILCWSVWTACKFAIALPSLRIQGYLAYCALLFFLIVLILLFGHLARSYYVGFKAMGWRA